MNIYHSITGVSNRTKCMRAHLYQFLHENSEKQVIIQEPKIRTIFCNCTYNVFIDYNGDCSIRYFVHTQYETSQSLSKWSHMKYQNEILLEISSKWAHSYKILYRTNISRIF